MSLETGMRQSKRLSLTWYNVNLRKGTAYLPDAKDGERKSFPLSPKPIASIIKLNSESKVLFPVSDNTIRLSWDKPRKRSGLEDIHFHDLRHEAIRGFFERVLNIAEVALTWGHKDPRMLKRYAEDIAKKLI